MRKLGAVIPAAIEATVSRPLLEAFARVLRVLSNIVSHQASCSFQKPSTEIDGRKKSEDIYTFLFESDTAWVGEAVDT